MKHLLSNVALTVAILTVIVGGFASTFILPGGPLAHLLLGM